MLAAAEGYLREREVEAPRLSVEWMLARVLGMSRLEVYMAHDRPLEDSERQRMREMVSRRGRGEPLAYILGDQEFCGQVFKVNSAVLIPRPETEGLVSLAVDLAPQGGRGADLGTGSGAIAVSVCKLREDVTMVATDVSPEALTVARENAEAQGVVDRVEFRQGSWWDPVADERFDFVLSNPPYVDSDRSDLLAEDVRKFEPAAALFPSGGVTQAYEELVRGTEGMPAGAPVLFETGVGASQAGLETMRSAPWLTDVELRDDEAGIPRYLLARRS